MIKKSDVKPHDINQLLTDRLRRYMMPCRVDSDGAGQSVATIN